MRRSTPPVLLAVRIDSHKVELFEFPTKEKAQDFIFQFRNKYGPVEYLISERKERRKKRHVNAIQLRLAI